MSRICAIIQELESTEFVVDFVTTAGAVATDDVYPSVLMNGKRQSQNGKLSHTKRQSADTCHHWGACGLGILCKRMRRGLKSSPSRSCCRTSLPLWCRSAGRCISWLYRRWQRHGPLLCRQWCKPPLRYSVQHR